MDIKQLSTGWWHIRLNGHRGWAQPPTWPHSEIERYIFDASPEFLSAVRAENDRLVQRDTVKRLNDLTPENNGRVHAEAADAAAWNNCQDDTAHGPATVFLVIAGERFELCVDCGVDAVRMLVEDTDGGDHIDVEVYR